MPRPARVATSPRPPAAAGRPAQRRAEQPPAELRLGDLGAPPGDELAGEGTEAADGDPPDEPEDRRQDRLGRGSHGPGQQGGQCDGLHDHARCGDQTDGDGGGHRPSHRRLPEQAALHRSDCASRRPPGDAGAGGHALSLRRRREPGPPPRRSLKPPTEDPVGPALVEEDKGVKIAATTVMTSRV